MEKRGIQLRAEPRATVGKKVRHLRRQGLVPAHIYGRGTSLPVQIEAKALQTVLTRAGRNALISLEIDGKTRSVLVRDVKRAPLNGSLVHVDLQEVALDEPIRTRVPVVLAGESPVARGDVMVVRGVDHVNIEGLPASLPPAVQADLSQLTDPGQVIHVSDLQVPEGVRILDDPSEVVAKLSVEVSEEVAPPAAIEEAAPEEVVPPPVPGSAEE